jgi:hypothetical protein
MEWFSTLSLALGSAWTSGINLYATVSVLGLLQKVGGVKLPGGLDVLDNWWIIGFAAGLYAVEFFADKIPYVDSVWDVIHTFIRIPPVWSLHTRRQVTSALVLRFRRLSLAAGSRSHLMEPKPLRVSERNLSPEPVSNWILSLFEDFVAFVGTLLQYSPL